MRLEGFEPPTNGFGSHYSIRLSYRRILRTSPPWDIAAVGHYRRNRAKHEAPTIRHPATDRIGLPDRADPATSAGTARASRMPFRIVPRAGTHSQRGLRRIPANPCPGSLRCRTTA